MTPLIEAMKRHKLTVVCNGHVRTHTSLYELVHLCEANPAAGTIEINGSFEIRINCVLAGDDVCKCGGQCPECKGGAK